MTSEGGGLPGRAAALLARLLPAAERAEVLEALEAEYTERARRSGRAAAWLWLWRQVAGSAPALVRRGWWRGWSGFEPRANRWRPGGETMDTLARDLRFAMRRLRRRPTYLVLTVLTLSLGVGGTASVHGLVRQLLQEPLPVRSESEVVQFWHARDWSDAEFVSVRGEMEGFASVAAYRPLEVGLRGDDGPARLVPGIFATAELFEVLGVRPAVGPGFRSGDDVQGAEPTVVLSHSLWRELGGDPGIVGARIELSGLGFTVTGVMPAGFWFPDPRVGVWLAQPLNPENQSGRHTLIGRLEPGMTLGAMQGPLQRLTAVLAERFTYPEQWDKTRDPALVPLREVLTGPVRPALLALLGAMAAILTIACVNVAALMLGQVDGRGTELAVRSALGAGRRRLLTAVLVESAVVGAVAGLVGAVLAAAGFHFLRGALPLGAFAETARLDWRLMASAMAIALLASTAVALAPALSVARSDLQVRLTRSRTGGIAGRGGRLESGLVVAQVAMVLLMAAGAALLIRSVGNLRAIDPGIRTEGVGVVDVLLPASLEPTERLGALREMVAAVESLPEVASAAAVQRLPMRGGGDNWGIAIEGRPELETTTTAYRMVTPGYFETMGIPIRSGRGLEASDALLDGDGVVVINRALAELYFAGVDPIGQRIAASSDAWMRIVGVVDDVAEAELTAAPVPARYVLFEHAPIYTAQSVAFRVAGGRDPGPLLDAARRAIGGAAPGVAIRELTTMRRVHDEALGPARQVMTLLTMLSGLALTLGVVGVYGVVSHFVTRRRRDWAVRLALGLRPSAAVRQIVAQGGALVVLGIGLGLGAFLLLANLLASFLYGVGTGDPLALAGATVILFTAGILAAAVPALRASRIDPALTLREQ